MQTKPSYHIFKVKRGTLVIAMWDGLETMLRFPNPVRFDCRLRSAVRAAFRAWFEQKGKA